MVFIISWNVSGWLRTAEQIRERYGCVDKYLEAHGSPDIICLQEVKIDADKLRKQDAKNISPTCSYHGQKCEDGECPGRWSSFWSISTARKGYSGVTTFVKKCRVVRATSRVFHERKFDEEGRCVAILFHGGDGDALGPMSRILVVNVYVPYGGSSEVRLDYKHDFLRALSGAIQRLRTEWNVCDCVLAGDMNVSLRNEDVHWLYRTYPADFHVLPTNEETDNMNANTARKIRSLFEAHEGLIDFEGVVKAAKQIGIDSETLQSFAESHGILPLSKFVCAKIFESLFCMNGSDQLYDSFLECHPKATDRFTCWDQSRNRRYTNVGTRIDYVFVSAGLLPRLQETKCQADKKDGPSQCSVQEYDCSGTCTSGPLMDATANGRWRPNNDPMREFTSSDLAHAHQFQRSSRPHTGMLYTPPQYSDHIAVTMKLHFPQGKPEKQMKRLLFRADSEWNQETHDCSLQNFIKNKATQTDITSFFMKRQVKSST